MRCPATNGALQGLGEKMRRNPHLPQYSGMLVGNPTYEIVFKDAHTHDILAQHSFTGTSAEMAEAVDDTIDRAGWRRHSFFGSLRGGPMVVYVKTAVRRTVAGLLHNPFTLRTRLVPRRGGGRPVTVDMMKMTPSTIYAIVPGMGQRVFDRRNWRVAVGA